MDSRKDGGPQEWASRHPEEGQRPDHAECSRPPVRPVQVSGGGGPDGHEHPAADRLDESRADQLVQVLRHPGEERSEREDDEGDHREPSRAPQVGEAPGERHHQDVDQQVPVDDPAGLAQLGPR